MVKALIILLVICFAVTGTASVYQCPGDYFTDTPRRNDCFVLIGMEDLEQEDLSEQEIVIPEKEEAKDLQEQESVIPEEEED